MYGADPKHFHFGTKTGCRRLFAEEGVPHPIGRERPALDRRCWSRAIAAMRAEQARARAASLVKLNEGVSGEGNASVDLARPAGPGAAGEREAIGARLREMQFETAVADARPLPGQAQPSAAASSRSGSPATSSAARASSCGSRRSGRSSCCRRTTSCSAGRAARPISAAASPPTPSTRPAITREAAKVGARLAAEGVIGRFALDFVTVRSGTALGPVRDRDQPAQGRHDAPVPDAPVPHRRHLRPRARRLHRAERAARSTSSRATTSRIAAYRGLTPDDLFDIVVRHGLHFDQSRQTGVVFHMMAALARSGWIGMTAVGDTAAGGRRDLPRGDRGARRGGCGLAASKYAPPRMPRAAAAAILAA